MKLITTLFFLFSPLLFASCTSSRCYPKNEKHQIELTLQKLRADIEEVKHDLHTQNMQSHVLDGKLLNHEDILASIQRDTLENHSTKLEKTESYLHKVEKKLTAVENTSQKLKTRLEEVVYYWEEMKKALSQSKTKMGKMEDSIISHDKAIEELSEIRKELHKLSLFIRDPFPKHSLEEYRVRKGDTLDKIAKVHDTSIETLMKINQLENPVVSPGQSLLVPLLLQEEKETP